MSDRSSHFGGVKNTIYIPKAFRSWSEYRGFDPKDAARFVLAWFTESQKSLDGCNAVQYTSRQDGKSTGQKQKKRDSYHGGRAS